MAQQRETASAGTARRFPKNVDANWLNTSEYIPTDHKSQAQLERRREFAAKLARSEFASARWQGRR